MTRAQYRMLGRLVRGERLRHGSFQPIGTVGACERKGLIIRRYTGPGFADARLFTWEATDLGRQRHAEQKPHPPVRD